MPLSLPWVWRAARGVLPMPSAARARQHLRGRTSASGGRQPPRRRTARSEPAPRASEDPDGLRQDLVADAPVQAVTGVEIGRDAQPLGKVVLDAHQIDDAEAGIGLKIDEEVDVASGTGLSRSFSGSIRRRTS